MIRFPCDRYEKTLAAEPQFAGQKVECPHCGDMNVVPLVPAAASQAQGVDAPGGPGEPVVDEQKLLFVRPSLFRSRPLLTVLLGLGPFALAAGLQFAATKAALGIPDWAWWVGAPLLGWTMLFAIWLQTCMKVALEVTNRRTTRINGWILRDRQDVFHRDVRSVVVPERSLWERMLNVGDVWIFSDEVSSREGREKDGAREKGTAKDGRREVDAEIAIRRLADPVRVKAAIDQFLGRWR